MLNRVTVLQNGDSPTAGRARQRLKFGGLAYAGARHGIDADEDMAQEGLVVLGRHAIEYAEAVLGPAKQMIDPNADSPAIRRALKRLGVYAIAYASSRHGVDAEPGLVREGMALLAQAAIEYYEVLASASPKKRSADAPLQIGSGA